MLLGGFLMSFYGTGPYSARVLKKALIETAFIQLVYDKSGCSQADAFAHSLTKQPSLLMFVWFLSEDVDFSGRTWPISGRQEDEEGRERR